MCRGREKVYWEFMNFTLKEVRARSIVEKQRRILSEYRVRKAAPSLLPADGNHMPIVWEPEIILLRRQAMGNLLVEIKAKKRHL